MDNMVPLAVLTRSGNLQMIDARVFMDWPIIRLAFPDQRRETRGVLTFRKQMRGR